MPQTDISPRNYPEKRPTRGGMHSVKPLTPREEEWIEEPSAELRKVIDEGLESIRQGEGRKYTLEELRVMMGL